MNRSKLVALYTFNDSIDISKARFFICGAGAGFICLSKDCTIVINSVSGEPAVQSLHPPQFH